jgi:hypothetical protein
LEEVVDDEVEDEVDDPFELDEELDDPLEPLDDEPPSELELEDDDEVEESLFFVALDPLSDLSESRVEPNDPAERLSVL